MIQVLLNIYANIWAFSPHITLEGFQALWEKKTLLDFPVSLTYCMHMAEGIALPHRDLVTPGKYCHFSLVNINFSLRKCFIAKFFTKVVDTHVHFGTWL